MSTQPVFSGAALRRHFLFVPGQAILAPPVKHLPFPTASLSPNRPSPPKSTSSIYQHLAQSPHLAAITSASRLEVHTPPELVSAGVAEVDALSGGLPRGCLTEICGPASSGRTSLMLAALAAATQRQEVCALVDPCEALDPQSAIAAGIDLKRLLWVRCSASQPVRNEGSPDQRSFSAARSQNRRAQEHKFGHDPQKPSKTYSLAPEGNPNKADLAAVENALRVTDLLLQSSGFGLVAIDLGNVPLKAARHIPLTSWFRFRRAVEKTSTVLLVIEQRPIAGSCSSLLLGLESSSQVSPLRSQESGPTAQAQVEIVPSHSQLLVGFRISAEILRSQWKCKPPQSVKTVFETKAAWGSRK